MSVTLKARHGHSLTAVSLGPGLTEVVEFGGSPNAFTGSIGAQPKMADTTLLQFSECPQTTIDIFTCEHNKPQSHIMYYTQVKCFLENIYKCV